MKRHLIYMDAKSSKFWKIEVTDCNHTVTYGRIGSAGQTSSKTFASAQLALNDANKLVKEKLAKGYVDAPSEGSAGPTTGGQLMSVAFPNIIHREEIFRNCGTFVGQRVVDYDPEKEVRSDVCYRFRSDWESDCLLENLEHYAQTPAAASATAMVIGAWQGDDSSTDSSCVIKPLVRLADRFPKLLALYLGDITSEENEMSWIQQSNLSPLLKAYPNLELLRCRGGEQLALAQPQHSKLRALALETGGLSHTVVESVLKGDFPELEFLELWLGTEDYGADVTCQHLEPLFAGTLFPKLKYLGLRNSEIADAVAIAISKAPILQRLEVLDLSLGTLGDEGAQALLKIDAPLKRLCLHHNYVGPELSKKLKALPIVVDLSNPSGFEMDDAYVAVGE